MIRRPGQPRAGQDSDFLEGFEAAASIAREAARLLDLMLAEHPDHPELPGRIRELEHDGDRVTHDLLHLLAAGAPARMDRQDVLMLASALDDVIDMTEEVADLFVLYRIEAPMLQAQELAHLLALSCAEVADALAALRSGREIAPHVVEINRLENEGDRVSREAIASLFEGGIDPMVVIRWKDVFERLEQAIDATERTANLLDGIRIKQG